MIFQLPSAVTAAVNYQKDQRRETNENGDLKRDNGNINNLLTFYNFLHILWILSKAKKLLVK